MLFQVNYFDVNVVVASLGAAVDGEASFAFFYFTFPA
jgi:hypothetical protein